MKRLALLLSLTLAGPAAAQSPELAELARRMETFEARTGVDLHLLGDPRERDSKPSFRKSQVGPVGPAHAMAALPVIEEALMRYNSKVRGTLLKDLYLVGKLRAGGKPWLGLAYPKYAAFDLAVRRRTSAAGLRATTHHEIAHMIETADFFPRTTWKAFSMPSYAGKATDTKWGEGKAARERYRTAGFVSRYGSKNQHEDFAELAELAFTNPRAALKLADRYPLIGDKLRLLTVTYRNVAPALDLPWLEKVARSSKGRRS